MSLALSICVLFISFMQSVNRAQFSNPTSLFPLFALSLPRTAIYIVPLTSIYAST